MEPLSLKTRRLFAVGSFFLFVLVLPVVALYASGYRLSGLSLVTTGGIHISTPISGVSIFLNGEEVDRSNLFSKSFFFDNLDPGSYVVQTSIEGYVPWSKNISVESRLVTDVAMLAVPQPFRILELVEATTTEPVALTATSTLKYIEAAAYADFEEEFLATTTEDEIVASTSEEVAELPSDTQSGVSLYVREGDLSARWERSTPPPSIFCTKPSACVEEFFIEKGAGTVGDARFFKGGVLYRTLESGVFFSELDVRQPRLQVSVYSSPESEYRVINNTLYIKDGSQLYEVANF